MTEKVIESFSRLSTYCIREDYKGYDPFEEYKLNPKKKRYHFYINDFDYALALLYKEGHLFITGSTNYIDINKNRQSVLTQLSLIEELIPYHDFSFNYLDFQSDNPLSEKIVSSTKLTTIFWANFYGKPYVEKYGREFLLNAPGWKTAELNDGSIEYIISEDIFTPVESKLETEIIKYFSQKVKVKLYRPIPIK